jgi:hypothetical protein
MTAGIIGTMGMVTTAQAVNIDPDGKGQVLLFPYYNVNNNFVTQFSITNTTEYYKVIKLRFRESAESNDVLDFNVYMSPYDQWTAAIRMNDAGGANIVTTDESCTYPDNSALKEPGANFLSFYDAVDVEDVTEGYLEVIEIGVIAAGEFDYDASGTVGDIGDYAVVDPSVADADKVRIADMIDHGNTGVPADCGAIMDAWNNGGFTNGAMAGGIAVDTNVINPYGADGINSGLVSRDTDGNLLLGGITGYSILLNYEVGAAFVADATAIAAYTTVPQHYRPDDADNYLLPSLASGNVTTSRIAAPNLAGVTTETWPLTYFDTGSTQDISPNPSIASGANPLPMAAALSATALSNDYYIEAAAGGSTDWVVTFPMKKHGVYNGATLTADADGVGVNNPACVPDTIDGYDVFPGDGLGNLCTNWAFNANDVPDAVVSFNYYDRDEQEESVADPDAGFSPVIIGTPSVTALPREVNIITFVCPTGDCLPVMGTPVDNVTQFNVADGFDQGWGMLTFGGAGVTYNYGTNASIEALVDPDDVSGLDAVTIDLSGVPAIGFSAIDADLGPASMGETIPHVRYVDR